MPVSRISFALADLRNEVKALIPDEDEREAASVDICLAPPVYDLVVRELEYHHHGQKLQKDDRHRGPGRAVRYAGMRLVCVPLGNR